MRRNSTKWALAATLLAGAALPTRAPAQGAAPPEVTEEQMRMQVVPVQNPAAKAKPAFAGPITNLDQIPDDFWTHANYDDIILKNDFAALTFGKVPDNPAEYNPARQGSILDIFTSPAAPENFQLLQPIINLVKGRTLLATKIETGNDPATGAATVTVSGNDTIMPGLTFTTVYKMEKGWPGALATTTIKNTTSDSINVQGLGDTVAWGAMGVFLPSGGWAPMGATVENAEFIFGRLYDSYIFIQPTQGLFKAQSGVDTSMLTYAENITLKPAETRQYARWILVGQGDPGALASFANESKGKDKFGYIAGVVQERVKLPDGSIHEAGMVKNGEVRIQVIRRADLGQNYVGKPYILTKTDENGHFQISLPIGEYYISFSNFSRIFNTKQSLATKVTAGKAAGVNLGVSRSATLIYDIVDAETGKPIPAKISLVPLRGTLEADFGPPGSLSSYNTIYTASGRGTQDVPAGNFRMIVSHGNEYHTTEQRVRFEPLKDATVKVELKRAFNPEGWISADLGVLTNRSAHSRITPEDRVVTAAAEGLDWIVTADPGTPTDLQPYVEKLGFADRLRASKGFRLKSDGTRAVGDYLLFPIEACAAGPNIDFSRVDAAKTPADAMAALRALCPNSVLIANRPIFPQVGVLTLQGYDFNTGTFPKADPVADFDGFQVWEGKRQFIVPQAMMAYYQLLDRGARITPIANSMSVGSTNEEVGYPRVYIASSTTDPKKLNLDELTRNIKQGLVQITNGPFIDLRVNGKGMGSLVSDTDGSVDVELKVYAPNWSNVASITVNQNGNFVRKFILPAGSTDADAGMIYPTARHPEEGKFTLTVKEDSIISVMVEGDQALNQDPVNPNLMPTKDPKVVQGQRTLAYSAPISIDTDGNGRLDFKLAAPAEEQKIPDF